MGPAPIALFIYNRPWHTQKAVEFLQKNSLAQASDLFIFADGPKNPRDAAAVVEVRDYSRGIRGFKSKTITAREHNFGVARSIIEGVTWLCRERGHVIVIEDDLLVSPYFLDFMNQGLDLYAEEDRVVSVHGYMYPIEGALPETFFLKGADCWGWATWQRGWNLFERDAAKLLAQLQQRRLQREFDFNAAYGYSNMLQKQVLGKIDSWAIRWYASTFLQNKLSLYPGRSLVRNIGFDGSGTHCRKSLRFGSEIAIDPIVIEHIPVAENIQDRTQVGHFLKSLKAPLLSRLKNRIRELI